MDTPQHPTVPLASGKHIPLLGLGMSHDGGYSHNALLYGLRHCGIRHIDTAKRYGNEEQVGKAIAESGVKREELWVTTKLWPGDYGYESALQACQDSCKRLGVEYLVQNTELAPLSFRFLISAHCQYTEMKEICRRYMESNVKHVKQMKDSLAMKYKDNQVWHSQASNN